MKKEHLAGTAKIVGSFLIDFDWFYMSFVIFHIQECRITQNRRLQLLNRIVLRR